jgi:hypothetical protein
MAESSEASVSKQTTSDTKQTVSGSDRERKKKMSVLKMSSQDVAKGVDAVEKGEIEALVKQSVEVDMGKVDIALFLIFEFQGFDPYAIMRKLIFFKNTYGLTDEDLKVDILYMIAANIYMGNLSGKALSRRGTDGREMVDELTSRYQIQAGTTGTGIASEIITFPRVAGSFPIITARMAQRLPTKDMVGQPFQSTAVPKFMRVNAFASFCPPQMLMRTRLFLLKASAAYSCDQSIVFQEGKNKKAKNKSEVVKVEPPLIAGDQWTYLWAASEGPVPPLYARSLLHAELNTISLHGTLWDIVTNYNKIVNDVTPLPNKTEYEQDITDFIAGNYAVMGVIPRKSEDK